MASRDKPHLIVSSPQGADYSPPPRNNGTSEALEPPPDRVAHGRKLRGDLRRAETDARIRRSSVDIAVEGAVQGTYVVFESFPGIELAVTTLDPRQGTVHPELRCIQQAADGSGRLIERATVFVPDGTMKYFLDRVSAYLESASEPKPDNGPFIDRIQEIRAASIEGLWTDPPEEFPEPGHPAWWEVWLRRRDGHEVTRLRAAADAIGMRVGRHTLGFGDRSVVLVHSTVDQLATAVDILDDLAELRRPHDPTAFIASGAACEQSLWVDELLERIEAADENAPAVCVVDSGVYWEHPLLKTSLDQPDCQVANPNWPVHDDRGHGTEMAGLALFGDLGPVVASAEQIRLTHRLESAKILPPPLRVRAGAASACLAALQGRTDLAADLLAPARTEAGLDPSPWNIALIDHAEGAVHLYQGNPAAAAACFERALTVFEGRTADQYNVNALLALGWAQALQGNHRQALEAFQIMLEITESSGESLYRSAGLWGAGLSSWQEGPTSEAQQLLCDSLRVARHMRSPVVAALDFEGLA